MQAYFHRPQTGRADYDAQGGRTLPHYLGFYYFSRFRLHQPIQAAYYAGYTNEIFGDLFHALFSRESETNVLAPTKYPSIEEVLEEVHGAGGIAVLAHPAFYDNFDEIEKYIDLGLDGIEVWHPSATEDDVHRLTEICKAHDLLMTGGSDFHGIYGAKTVTLGTCTTPQEWVDKLLGYKAKKKRAQRRAEKEAAARAAAQTQE